MSKDTSPAAAPAQLSEALRAALAEVKRMTSVGPPVPPGRKPAPGEGWYNLVLRVNAFAAVALAGQPAPTEDREALRAAALAPSFEKITAVVGWLAHEGHDNLASMLRDSMDQIRVLMGSK